MNRKKRGEVGMSADRIEVSSIVGEKKGWMLE